MLLAIEKGEEGAYTHGVLVATAYQRNMSTYNVWHHANKGSGPWAAGSGILGAVRRS